MKFAFALLALVATSSAIEIPNIGKGELAKDLQEFLDLIPVEEVLAVTLEYLAEDEEFQNAIIYLQSEEFKGLVKDVEDLPEIRNLMDYIQNAGVDIYYLVNMLNEALGLDKLVPPTPGKYNMPMISGGVKGYINDILAVLPIDELEKLYEHKLKTSKVFADFIAQISSPEFQKIVDTVYANEKFQSLLEKARQAGIDLQAIADLLYAIFGIKVPAKPAPRFFRRF